MRRAAKDETLSPVGVAGQAVLAVGSLHMPTPAFLGEPGDPHERKDSLVVCVMSAAQKLPGHPAVSICLCRPD